MFVTDARLLMFDCLSFSVANLPPSVLDGQGHGPRGADRTFFSIPSFAVRKSEKEGSRDKRDVNEGDESKALGWRKKVFST